MEIHVRPFHPHDYPRLAKLRQEAEGERITVEELRRFDEQWDHSRFEKLRVIAQDEESVAIGYGELHHEPDRFDPRCYFLQLAVDPAYQRRGVATALWDHMKEELDERAATFVRLRTLPMGPGAQWAERQGFRWSGDDRTSRKVTYELRLGRAEGRR